MAFLYFSEKALFVKDVHQICCSINIHKSFLVAITLKSFQLPFFLIKKHFSTLNNSIHIYTIAVGQFLT